MYNISKRVQQHIQPLSYKIKANLTIYIFNCVTVITSYCSYVCADAI